jgi:AraC-like DNA-binding protein
MLPGRRAQAWRHQPAFRRPRHFHEEPEINLVTRGTCVLGVGDRQLQLTAGQLVVFQPGQDHELIEASPDLDLYVFALRPELHARALGPGPLAAIDASALAARELTTFEAELGAVGELRDAGSVDTRVADLFARALQGASKANATSRRIVESLRAEQSLTEGALAARLRTTPSGVSRHFRHALGIPLVEYRARLRLMRFIDLVDSGTPYTQAALEADFGSYTQCYRVFTRILRCSPQHYFAGARTQLNAQTAQHEPRAGERTAPLTKR